MDLDEMICRSIMTIENDELRKRLANQIILVGGPCKSNKMIEMLEQSVISKMHAKFDTSIERCEVILCNIQQQQAYLLQQQELAKSLPADEEPSLKFKTDPRYLSWIGGSILPKLESAKDMFVSRDKFQAKFTNYKEQFLEQKNK